MKRRSFMCLLLVFCMVLQMLAPAFAIQAKNTSTSPSSQRSDDVSKAQEEFMKSYETIMALEEVDVGKVGSACVGAVTLGTNGWTALKNGFDKVFNDGKNQQEYVDYMKDIEDANAKSRQAKKDAQAMKKQYDAGKIGDAKKADVNKRAEKGFGTSGSLHDPDG